MATYENVFIKLQKFYEDNPSWYQESDKFFDYFQKILNRFKFKFDAEFKNEDCYPLEKKSCKLIEETMRTISYQECKAQFKKFLQPIINYYGEDRVSVTPIFCLQRPAKAALPDYLFDNSEALFIEKICIDIHYPDYTLTVGDNVYPMKDMFVRLMLKINHNTQYTEGTSLPANLTLSSTIEGRRTTVNAREFFKNFAHPHLNNNSKYEFTHFCKGVGGELDLILTYLQNLDDFEEGNVIELLLNIESLLSYENTASAYGGKQYKDVIVLEKAKPLSVENFKRIPSMEDVSSAIFYKKGGELIPLKDARYKLLKKDLVTKFNFKGNIFYNGKYYANEELPHLTKQPITINYKFRGKPIPFIVEDSIHNNNETEVSLNPLLEKYVITNIQIAAYRKAYSNRNTKTN